MLNTNIGTPTNQQSFIQGPASVGQNTSQSYQQQQQQNSSFLNNTLNQNQQNVSMTGGQGGIGSVQNNQEYSMLVDQSPLLSGNIKPQSKSQPNVLTDKNQPAKLSKESTTAISQSKPGKLKPLDFIPILNKKNFFKSNLDMKFYLNSLCFSLNLSDTFNNCYRDINFDSCTLCVCNNNYLKGLDYSIYICNDIFNSNIDYYDYSDQIEGSEQAPQPKPNSSQLISKLRSREIYVNYVK